MTATHPRGRPWQRNRPRPRRPDVVIRGEAPLAEITVYRDLTLLTRRTPLGTWRSYPVDPAAVAQTLANLPQGSGLLPRDTLAAGRVAGTPFFVVYVAPHRRTLTTTQTSYTIPLPPLIWAGCGADYRLWALGGEGYPTRTGTPLFKAPFPNCYGDGRICWGDVGEPPPASSETLDEVLDLFLEGSRFNLHLANGKSVRYPSSVISRWAQLAKRKGTAAEAGYPLRDLIPAEYTLGWLIGGGPWQT